jgi:DNA-binding transcriptional ArsR family regulator
MPDDFTGILRDTLKHPLRGAILYQLLKGKITASQIAENLGEKPDRIYYHLKILKENGFLGEPEIAVRKNYVEKYYELDETFRENLISSLVEISRQEKTMSSEEFRSMMLSFLSITISVLQGYKKRIETAEPEKISEFRRKNSFEAKIVFFHDTRFLEWLNQMRTLSHGSMMEMLMKGAKGNIGLVLALPDVD